MIKVDYIKPFYTKVTGSKMRMVFAYQYLAIIKDGERYNFIPIEGKEVNININTKQVENLSEVFVFQRGNRSIRLPLYQLLLVSDLMEYLIEIMVDTNIPTVHNHTQEVVIRDETEQLMLEIEQMHIKQAIDRLLETRDYEGIRKLQEFQEVKNA